MAGLFIVVTNFFADFGLFLKKSEPGIGRLVLLTDRLPVRPIREFFGGRLIDYIPHRTSSFFVGF
jgi:hypothetical protein